MPSAQEVIANLKDHLGRHKADAEGRAQANMTNEAVREFHRGVAEGMQKASELVDRAKDDIEDTDNGEGS